MVVALDGKKGLVLGIVNEHRLVSVEEVGAVASFLVGDRAKSIAGDAIHVDAGYHVAD